MWDIWRSRFRVLRSRTKKKEKNEKPKKKKRSTQIPEFEARSILKVKLCLQKNAEYCEEEEEEEEEEEGGWRMEKYFLPISAHYVQNRCVRYPLQFFFFCRTGARKLASSVYLPYFFHFFSGKNFRRLFLPFI